MPKTPSTLDCEACGELIAKRAGEVTVNLPAGRADFMQVHARLCRACAQRAQDAILALFPCLRAESEISKRNGAVRNEAVLGFGEVRPTEEYDTYTQFTSFGHTNVQQQASDANVFHVPVRATTRHYIDFGNWRGFYARVDQPIAHFTGMDDLGREDI